MAGTKICPEYRIRQEILSIAAKEGVSRSQASVILHKNNPDVRMNFAEALKKQESQSTSTTSSRRTAISPDRLRALRQTKEILCQSPSGRLFTQTVAAPFGIPDPPLHESELTSENNPAVREQVKRIYDEVHNDDLESYEEELRRAKRSFSQNRSN